MEYIYTAMLLHSGGKKITEESVEKVLKAAGIEPDASRIKALTASLEGVNIDEAISKGFAMPSAQPAPAAEKKEEKKDDKKDKKEEEKVSEEEAAAGLGALFG